ncbi:MAG: bifunctional diguanylate cyclase/phosphodiesterase, partial [Steroidobacteraceae bacterium]
MKPLLPGRVRSKEARAERRLRAARPLRARTRSLVASCIIALILTAAIFQLARTVLMRSFADMEDDAARQGVEHVRRSLGADLATLGFDAARASKPWWPLDHALATGVDASAAAAQLTREAFAGKGVDLVWITNAQGMTVYSAALAPRAHGELAPLSQSTLAILSRDAQAMAAAAGQPPLGRLIRLPRGALAFAVASVDPEGGAGPSAGQVLIGRYLDRAVAARAAGTSQLPVAITLVDGPDALHLPETVRRWLASMPLAAAPFLALHDARVLNGYTLLRDVSGEPLAVLSTGVHRDALALGRERDTILIIAVVGGFGCIVLALLVLLNRLARARTLTERRYRSVGRQLDESILLADAASGAIVEANPAVARALGYNLRELTGITLQDLSRGLTAARLARLRERLAGRSRVLTMRGKDGRSFPAEVTFTWIRLDRQELVCLVARDITERRALERQSRAHRRRLIRIAHRDALTGLPNRLYLDVRLPQLTAEAERAGVSLALLYVDLDHFKDVNDSLGHNCGDRLLGVVARRLRGCISERDLVVRMGGDEFIVIAAGLSAAADAVPIARRIEESLATPLEIDGARLNIIASIGISLYPADGSNLEELLKHADIALYQAKSRGRGNYQFFSREMQTQLADRLELAHALKRAIGTSELHLEYQPSFDMRSGAPVGFEALLRWNHPQLGMVPPSRFIPIAEQGNLILELGAWVLREVCRQLGDWQRAELPLLPVSINVTPSQFEHGRLAEAISALTREFDVDAHLLYFEITESAAMQDSELQLGALQALRRLGSRILIDDFGTGYSSLAYLKHLPIDTLKIDRAFVRDMASDVNDAAIVSAIVGIARSLGLHVVAEGVETIEQVDCLVKLGCETAQGFFYSRPLAPADARRVLERLGARRRVGETAKLAVLRGGGGLG